METIKALLENFPWPFIVGAAGQPQLNWTRVFEALIISAAAGSFAAGLSAFFIYAQLSKDMEHVVEKVDRIERIVEQAHPRQ